MHQRATAAVGRRSPTQAMLGGWTTPGGRDNGHGTRSCRSSPRGSHIHRWSQLPELAAAPLRVVRVEWVVDQFVNIVGGPTPTGRAAQVWAVSTGQPSGLRPSVGRPSDRRRPFSVLTDSAASVTGDDQRRREANRHDRRRGWRPAAVHPLQAALRGTSAPGTATRVPSVILPGSSAATSLAATSESPPARWYDEAVAAPRRQVGANPTGLTEQHRHHRTRT
jgi:hypothetical protein